jgi:Zn-dependent protease
MADFSLDIGKIDGIKVELHWTFILLLIFILFLSFYLFILWVLLFVCVLIHEMVHSITSRRNGIEVKKIVLYPFGGGSIINFDKVKPELEFRISIVGPIASLLLAMLFAIATIFTPAGMVKSTLQILFLMNIFLGVFNLLPWLPLDGGRALRSYLQKKRSFLESTKLAVKISNIVTVIFIVGTIIYAIYAAGYSTTYREFIVLFDIVIAFFIFSGARAEMQSAIIKDGVSDLKVKDAMSNNYIVLEEKTKVEELYDIMVKTKMNIILFQKNGKVYMVSNPSLQKLLKKNQTEGNIGAIGAEIPTIKYGTKLYSAIENMRASESGIVAVLRGKKIVGILLISHIEAIIALHMSKKKN